MIQPINQPGNPRTETFCLPFSFGNVKHLCFLLLIGLFGLPLSAATFTVTNLSSQNPSTSGTLPWAIAQANATVGLDVIEFSVAGTVRISSGLVISDPVSIDGTTAPGYSAGAPSVVVLFTLSGGTIMRTSGSFSGLTVKGLELVNEYIDPTDALTHTVAGLRVLDCSDVSIEGNVFRNLNSGGLAVVGGADVRVLDNTFIDVGRLGGSFTGSYSLDVDGVNQGVGGNRLMVAGNTFAGGSNAVSLSNLPGLTVSNTGSPEVLLLDNDGKKTVQGSALRVTNSSDVVIEDMDLSYTGGGTTNGSGLYLENCANTVARNLTIGNRVVGIQSVNSEEMTIEDNDISNAINQAVWISGGNDVTVINNSISNSAGPTYFSLEINSVSYGASGNRLSVRGNTFAGGFNAVLLRSMPGITVANTGNPEVLLPDNDGKGTVGGTALTLSSCPNIVIENFDLSYTEGQDLGGAGLSLTKCHNSVVRNIKVSNRLDGIVTFENDVLTIENNTLENLPHFALSVVLGSDARVLDNSITNCGGRSGVTPVEFKSIKRHSNGNRLTASGFIFTNTVGGITVVAMPGIIISDGTISGTEISLTAASQLEQVDATVLQVQNSPGSFVENLTIPPFVGTSNKVERGIRFTFNDSPTVRGVTIWGRDVGVEVAGLYSGTVTITENSLAQNGVGVVARAFAGSGTVNVANNNFACNENAVVAFTNAVVDAPDNYWGAADGSQTDGGSGDPYLEDGGTITNTTTFSATPVATAPAISIIPGSTCPGILPLELTTFTGRAVGKQNMLEWTTASEEAFSHYELERSSDLTANWDVLGAVAGAGQVGQAEAYSYTDVSPPGSAYYRLRMVDLDGNFAYSHIVELQQAAATELVVYPNPNNGRFTVQLPTNEPTILTLDHLNGRFVWQRKTSPAATSTTRLGNSLEVSSTGLTGGVYLLSAKTASNRWVKRIIIR